MKITAILVASIMGMAVQTWACPTLTGTYLCGEEEVSVETFELDGVNYFEINGNSIPANSEWMALPDSEDERNVRIKMSCGTSELTGDHFKLDYESEIFLENKKEGTVDIDIFFHHSSEGDLAQTTTGSAKGSWGEQVINEKSVCTKK